MFMSIFRPKCPKHQVYFKQYLGKSLSIFPQPGENLKYIFPKLIIENNNFVFLTFFFNKSISTYRNKKQQNLYCTKLQNAKKN